MDFESLNIQKEQQERYNKIKEKGEYLELNILIGTDGEETEKGVTARIPVVSSTIHKCGSDEISCLYSILKLLVEHYRKEYPLECLYADFATKTTSQGCVEISKEILDDEEE